MNTITTETAHTKIKIIKMHKSVAKAKLLKLGQVSLSNIHEYEKQLRIIQSCNNNLKSIRKALSALKPTITNG